VSKSYAPPLLSFTTSASNLAYSAVSVSVDANSTRTLTLSGISFDVPSLFITENASLNSSVGEFLVKSTLAPVKCI
jgi:hypothetical protein